MALLHAPLTILYDIDFASFRFEAMDIKMKTFFIIFTFALLRVSSGLDVNDIDDDDSENVQQRKGKICKIYVMR